jgi:hypothetical protein
MKQRLLILLRAVTILKRLINKELKTHNGIGLRKKCFCYSKGFFSDAYVLYDFGKTSFKNYLNDIQENIFARHINRPYLTFIDNKLMFSLLVTPYGPALEETMLVMNGKLIHLGPGNRYNSWESLIKKMIDETKEYIVKEIDGASGTGVFKISTRGNDLLINEVVYDASEFISRLCSLDNYMISPFIKQARYSDIIYGQSVNTVRLLTMINPDTNMAFIAAAAHRFGTKESFPVDNCARGGLTARIDIETGKMGKATRTKVRSGRKEWFSHHPDSGSVIEGVEVPLWHEIVKHILVLSERLSFVPYIGWDIVVLENGFTIIEGNDGPDIKLHQVHEPLLVKEEVRRFYQHYNVI